MQARSRTGRVVLLRGDEAETAKAAYLAAFELSEMFQFVPSGKTLKPLLAGFNQVFMGPALHPPLKDQ